MTLFRFALMSAILLLASTATAHNIWINPADYFPESNSTTEIGIGWGHKYLADRTHEKLKEGKVEEFQVMGPDGKPVESALVTNGQYRLNVGQPGAYLITTKIKPGFFTTTPEGIKWSKKNKVTNAVKCTNYHISGKSLIMVGNSDKGFEQTAGQALELIPITNPARLTANTAFKVRVLFRGQPVADVALKATYAGFEKEEEKEPAHPDTVDNTADKKALMKKEEKKFPAEAVTGAQGEAELHLTRPGYWMISLSHRHPYPDVTVCDQYMYSETFTFQVK